MTNREMFTEIVNGNLTDEVKAKAAEEIAKLDARNAARKGKESKTQKENKPIIEAIANLLTDEPMLANAIAEKLEISVSKASSLVKKVEGVKITDVKVKGKGVRKAYSLQSKGYSGRPFKSHPTFMNHCFPPFREVERTSVRLFFSENSEHMFAAGRKLAS